MDGNGNGKPSFTAACKTFFGTESLAKFREEFKRLTPADKTEIYDGLRANGVDCNPPSGETLTA